MKTVRLLKAAQDLIELAGSKFLAEREERDNARDSLAALEREVQDVADMVGYDMEGNTTLSFHVGERLKALKSELDRREKVVAKHASALETLWEDIRALRDKVAARDAALLEIHSKLGAALASRVFFHKTPARALACAIRADIEALKIGKAP